MDDWFAGSDWGGGDDWDVWDSGDWDDSWDYGMEGDGGDFSDQGYDWDAVFGGDGSGSGDGTNNWWNSFTGNNGQSTNWMQMLLSGTGQYLNQRSADRNAEQGREHDIALTILRDQLANQEYDRRQGQLRDAYAGYNDMTPANPNQGFNLLSGYKPRPVSQGAQYYGY